MTYRVRMVSNRTNALRSVARIILGVGLVGAGIAHLGVSRAEFRAQVPDWLHLDKDFVVLASGVVEIALGLALVAVRRYRRHVGLLAGLFFIAILPGNISQWLDGHDAFGLDSDAARFTRLWFQPVLVAWAWWSTGALTVLSRPRRSSPPSAVP